MSETDDEKQGLISSSDETPTTDLTWNDKYAFPCGAVLMMFYTLVSGMGSYFFTLSMPVYMSTMLRFPDSKTTAVYHAKSSLNYFVNVLGAVLADSWLGRAKTYLAVYPFQLAVFVAIGALSIYTLSMPIIALYFSMSVIGGIVGPAINALIPDQIPKEKSEMLSAYMHIVYLINNLGVIFVAFIAPIMHKDIYCFGMECYPLIFFISAGLMILAYTLVLSGYSTKQLVTYEVKENVMLNIVKCGYYALKKRISLGRAPKGSTWLDYAKDKYDAILIRDMKTFKRLLVFLIAHPFFYCVFEQMASVWTLQAGYMNGRITDKFIIKADQMQSLNPLFVIVIIPLFQLIVYPFMKRLNFRLPYRIMLGQIFVAFACVSLIFIQIGIDKSHEIHISKNSNAIKFLNMQNDVRVFCGKTEQTILAKKNYTMVCDKTKLVKVNFGGDIVKSLNIDESQFGKPVTVVIANNRAIKESIEVQKNGGYALVRGINTIGHMKNPTILLEGKFGLSKNFEIKAKNFRFGKYVKCGVGKFDVYLMSPKNATKTHLGLVQLLPAQSLTIALSQLNQTKTEFVSIEENRFTLLTITWQVIPYFLATIGEVFFTVNTSIFLYSEAPDSMKCLMMAGQSITMGFGNTFILILSQIVGNLGKKYMFIVCSSLAFFSAVVTGCLSWYYLRRKDREVVEYTTVEEYVEIE